MNPETIVPQQVGHIIRPDQFDEQHVQPTEDAHPTDHLRIEFYAKPDQNMQKSLAEGRPVFEPKEFCKVWWAGEKNRGGNVYPAHIVFMKNKRGPGMLTPAQAFPRHYAAFKKNEEVVQSGTPLEELPFLTSSRRAELKARHVHTAEAFMSLDGDNLKKLGMHAREEQAQIRAWMADAKDGALRTQLAAENEALKARLDALEAQMLQPQAAATAPSSSSSSESGDEMAVFGTMADDDLKAFIKDRAGAAPRGNPSRDTLLRMCGEIVEKERAEAA